MSNQLKVGTVKALCKQISRLEVERNNAEKREYEVLGRANALEVELKATRTRSLTQKSLTMKGEMMNKKMYEVNWHSIGDKFSHCTVTAITVTRESILPGSTGVTITAIDHEGRKFQGSPGDYHNTEAEAWAEVKVVISEQTKGNKSCQTN